MNSRNQSYIIYLLLFIAIIAMLFYSFRQSNTAQDVLNLNQVASDIRAGKVTRIIADENRLRVIYADGEKTSNKETNSTLVQQLLDLGVTSAELDPAKIKLEVKPPSAWLGIITALGYILPFIILAGVFWFIFRQAQGSNNAAMSFGKSRARMFSGDQPTVTFADVAGVEEAKEELKEVVEFLREPQKFIALALVFQKVYCLLVLLELVKPFSPKQYLVKQVFLSSPFLVLNLLKCLWVSVQAVFETYLNRQNATHPVSFLSMKSMQSDVNVVLDWVAVMMNVNRP